MASYSACGVCFGPQSSQILLIKVNSSVDSHRVENPLTPSMLAHWMLLHCSHSKNNSFLLFCLSSAFCFTTKSNAFSHKWISPLDAVFLFGSSGNGIVCSFRFSMTDCASPLHSHSSPTHTDTSISVFMEMLT